MTTATQPTAVATIAERKARNVTLRERSKALTRREHEIETGVPALERQLDQAREEAAVRQPGAAKVRAELEESLTKARSELEAIDRERQDITRWVRANTERNEADRIAHAPELAEHIARRNDKLRELGAKADAALNDFVAAYNGIRAEWQEQQRGTMGYAAKLERDRGMIRGGGSIHRDSAPTPCPVPVLPSLADADPCPPILRDGYYEELGYGGLMSGGVV